MDLWGIIIFVGGIIGYFASRRKWHGCLFVAGIGAGIVIGAIWAMMIVNSVIP